MIENTGTHEVQMYSAEHLVVSPENGADPAQLIQKLSQAGFEVHKPFSLSNFIYLTPRGDSPDEIMDTLEDATSILVLANIGGIVELDSIGRTTEYRCYPTNGS